MGALTVRITKKSDRIESEIGRRRQRIAQSVGRNTQAAASLMYQLCPVGPETGRDHTHLRDTIVIEQEGDLKQRIRIMKKVGRYWLWRLIEFGTRYMAAQPFVRLALESSRRGFLSDLQAMGYRRR